MQKPTIGQKIEMPVYGKLQTVTVLAVHPFGTIYIETATGACFRITGLSFIYQGIDHEKLRIRDTFSTLLRNDAFLRVPNDDNVKGTT